MRRDVMLRLAGCVLVPVLVLFGTPLGLAQEHPESDPPESSVAQSKGLTSGTNPTAAVDPGLEADYGAIEHTGEVAVGSVAWETSFDDEIGWQFTTVLGVLVVSSGNHLYGVDGLTGKSLWDYPVCVSQESVLEIARTHMLVLLDVDPEECEAGVGAAGAVTASNTGQSGRHMMAIDQLTGDKLWTSPRFIDEDPVYFYPMYDQQKIFLVTVDKGFFSSFGKAVAAKLTLGIAKGDKPTGHSYLLDLVDGTIVWDRTVEDPGNLRFELNDDDVLEMREKNVLDIAVQDGETRWKMDIKDKSVEVADGKLIIAEGKISAYDLAFEDKKDLKQGMLWKSKPTKALGNINYVEAHGDKLFFAGNKGFACLDANTGDILWDESKDGKGRPMSLDISPNGEYILGIVEKHVKVLWVDGHDSGSIRLQVMRASDGTVVGEFPSDDSEQNYIPTGEVKEIRWLDESRIFLESDQKQLALEIKNGELGELWKRDRPPKLKFPEDIEAEKKAKKKAALMSLGVLAAGLIGANQIGSDFGQILMVAGSVAVAAALIDTANDPDIMGKSDETDPNSRIAYERYKRRQERYDTRKKIEVVQGQDGYDVIEIDLLTGECTTCGTVPTRGRARPDTMFRLVYQTDFDTPNTLRAYVVQGYSASTVSEFSS